MSDTRPVPTNLDSWPGVLDLVVTYKHILHVLWSSPTGLMSIIGVGQAGILEHICGASRLDEPVVLEALRELHRRGLVVLDENTREVAVRRWCRFHKFGGRWDAQARKALDKIESNVIKSVLTKQEGVNSLFPEKSNGESPSSNCNINYNTAAPRERGKNTAAAPPKKFKLHHSGVECWDKEDFATAEQLAATFPRDDLNAAIAATVEAGKRPVPGTVTTFLHKSEKTKAAQLAHTAHLACLAKQDAASNPPPPTADQLNRLPARLQKTLEKIKNSQGVAP